MSDITIEIRRCTSCGLRYPVTQGHGFGVRCPHCLGATEIIRTRTVLAEGRTREKPLAKAGTSRAILLDNIRSAWNVGSILRSADGFGFEHAYLCGITPSPENEAVTKTSLGAEEFVTWSQHKDAVACAKALKQEGWKILALEESLRAKEIGRATSAAAEKSVLILGSEVNGVDPDLLDLCDEVYYIPMQGQKRSFNVAIAFSIAAYALTTGESLRGLS